MRYLAPAILCALILGGCASTCHVHEEDAAPEPAPEVKTTESVPLLEDILILGFMFKQQEAKAASSEVPLLKDIPILGPLFKLQDAQPDKK